MKKIKIIVAVFSLLTMALVSQFQNNKTTSVLENLEIVALADGEGGTSNTGPLQKVDCPGWFTGSAHYCMCTESSSCTQKECN